MVIVVFTRAGYEDMRQLVSGGCGPVWVNDGVLFDKEISDLRKAGIDLTAFSSTIDPASAVDIENAISIIAEHHPNDRLWVEIQAGSPPPA